MTVSIMIRGGGIMSVFHWRANITFSVSPEKKTEEA